MTIPMVTFRPFYAVIAIPRHDYVSQQVNGSRPYYVTCWDTNVSQITNDNLSPLLMTRYLGSTRGGTRTRTIFRSEDFKSSASAIPPLGQNFRLLEVLVKIWTGQLRIYVFDRPIQ